MYTEDILDSGLYKIRLSGIHKALSSSHTVPVVNMDWYLKIIPKNVYDEGYCQILAPESSDHTLLANASPAQNAIIIGEFRLSSVLCEKFFQKKGESI